MGGRSSQRKGRNGERELANTLRGYGYDVRPSEPLNYGKEPDLSGLPGIHIECKRCQQLRIGEWMHQAAEDAEKFKDGAPAVFFRRDREPWRVVMDLEDWMAVYKAQRCRCGGHCSAAETGEKRSGYCVSNDSNHGG